MSTKPASDARHWLPLTHQPFASRHAITPQTAPMHLVVPFASAQSEAGQLALQSLSLPALEGLLARCAPGTTLGRDAYSANTPHDQALAHAWGWPGQGAAPADDGWADVALPFAAQAAAALKLPDAHSAAWGLLSPVHLQAGREQIQLTDPAGLQLDEAQSRALLAVVAPLFESEGFTLHWASPLQWLATHATQFDTLPCASLDRVIGRHLDPWLPSQPNARLLRRLQNEVQMLLYTHPLTEAREAAGLAAVNSFWLSGCGRLPSIEAATRPTEIHVDERLRAPALAEDWAAWAEAWAALDAGPITALRGQPGARLTLCGERFAQGFEASPQGWWQRVSANWRKSSAPHWLLPL